MLKKPLLGLALLLTLAAACTSAPAPGAAATDSPVVPGTTPQATAEEAAVLAAATDVPPTATAVPAAEAQAESVPGHPDQRTAPASPDEYVEDVAAVVGFTGRPQLLEFFTYW